MPGRAGSRPAAGSTCAACTTVRVASVPQASTPESAAPSLARWSLGAWVHAWEHRRGTPRTQDRHVPHGTAQDKTTRSPARTWSTPSPTCSTIAGAFVTEQHRERHPPVPVVTRPEVAVADTARDDAHLDLARVRVVDPDRLDDDRSAGLVDDRPHRFARHDPLPSLGRGSLYCARVDAGTLRDIAALRYDGFVDGAGDDGERRLRLVHAGRGERDRRPLRDTVRGPTGGRSSDGRIGQATVTRAARRSVDRPPARCRWTQRPARRSHGYGLR